MQTTLIVLFTIIIIITIMYSIYINNYGKLIYYKIRVDKAEKEIETELENRYSLVKQAENAIKKSARIEIKEFKELDDLKEKNSVSPIELDNKLTEVITIYMVQDDYPKIAKKKDLNVVLSKLNTSDTNILAAKSFYNKNNNSLNELLKKFPSKLIARIKNINIQPSYDIKEIIDTDKEI